MNKFAGVIFDYYDDKGATLKAKFPTADQVPEVIKTANVRPKGKVPNEAFAVVMLDEGYVFRKFACEDPGTTAMSVIYFMEHGDKLPEDAQKIAAHNIVNACISHRLMPPAALTKISQGTEKANVGELTKQHEEKKKQKGPEEDWGTDRVNANVLDTTGKKPPYKAKLARPTSDEDYAVVLQDGSRHYPIDTWDRIKMAEQYFSEERVRMQPHVRRQFAVKLASKSAVVGYPLDTDIIELGAVTYADGGHIKAAIEMRKAACDPGADTREWLDDLFEKRATIQPKTFAECLRRFDVGLGFDHGWDQVIPDPWSSTFGIKTASVVWSSGAERVTDDDLTNLARNHIARIKDLFSDDFVEEFQKDPVTIFNSMPDPQKKLLARLAADSASMGGSEHRPTGGPEGGSEALGSNYDPRG